MHTVKILDSLVDFDPPYAQELGAKCGLKTNLAKHFTRLLFCRPAEQILNAPHDTHCTHRMYRSKTQYKEGCDVVKLTDPV